MNDSLDEKNNNLKWIQEPEYIDIDNFGHDQGWHPKLTQEQIAFALSKDIYEPKGIEYEQFLMELGLKPIVDDELVKPGPEPGPNPPTFPGPEPGPNPPIFPGPEPGPNTTPVPPIDPIEHPEEEKEKKEDEDFVKVVRVEKHFQNRITAWLCGAAVALILASGLSIDKPIKNVDVQTSSIVVTQTLQYSLTEQLKEFGYEDKLIESMVYKFAADYNFSIGDSMNLKPGTDAYYYGNETGRSITIGGQQAITGFCLYSPSDVNNKYEYSFYEDRNLDGNPERTNVDGITKKVDVSIDDFLSKLDSSNYNLDDVRFSLCFGHKGWVDFSDLISINEEKQQVNVQQLVEICKDGATYEGIQEDAKSNYITITSADGSNIQIPIVDEDNKQLPNGSRVLGSDGREYVISSLKTVTEEKTETIIPTESIEGDSKLKWNILDCELAAGLAPLALAAGFAIASKLKNEKYKKDPNFFKFENEEDYAKFKNDFEQARKQRTSKFRETIKRMFYGEELHVSKDLTEDQIEELYTRITTTHNGDYSYKPTDQIRFKNGQIYAVSQDESVTNLTSLVHDIGVKNPVSAEGILTENIVEQYGGGHAK